MLYAIAVLQAVAMVLLLHVFDGFSPMEMGRTIGFACLTSVAFMSVMYFFTNFIGKVGSFLMLVFMVVQLAGSVGTYPLEISGSFVPYLHEWVPVHIFCGSVQKHDLGWREYPGRGCIYDHPVRGIYGAYPDRIPAQGEEDQSRQTYSGRLAGRKGSGITKKSRETAERSAGFP